MEIKYQRLYSEPARLFGVKISLELLHTKNVIEASVLRFALEAFNQESALGRSA
jgi:hypothetical protein